MAITFYNIYIHAFSQKINFISVPTLFADDTTFIISKDNYDDFKQMSNCVLSLMCLWFDANQLVLNAEKPNTIKFKTDNLPHYLLLTGLKKHL
jgi:hypothetical protein